MPYKKTRSCLTARQQGKPKGKSSRTIKWQKAKERPGSSRNGRYEEISTQSYTTNSRTALQSNRPALPKKQKVKADADQAS
jgi:hypothetical protein